jgi:DNA-binding response OmpR family regulator/two-component sensor histidine kinase
MRKPTVNKKNNTNLVGVSHDVKTLLNGVLCMSSLLEDTALSVEQAEIVQLLRKSATDLKAMMTGILDQSHKQDVVYSDKIEAFNIEEEIKLIFNTFKLTINQKPIQTQLIIDKSVPATVKGNKSAFNRILNNLLHNAGKFTDTGVIELRVKTESKNTENVVLLFDVIDSGMGISTKNIKNIFNRYAKFNSDGYGIGLATAKELVESLEGHIAVESKLNKGTKFTVTMPFEVINFAAVKKTIPLSIKALKNKKILIADDDVVYKKYLTSILKQYDVELTTVNSGEKALKLIDNQRFDLILLDLGLPCMDGFSTSFEIKNTRNLNTHTPIVGISASEADSEKVKACGMIDLLQKPLNAESLTFRLQRILEENKVFLLQNKNNNKLSIANFNFNKKLNEAHLIALYGKDIEHAYMIFDTFLTESLPAFYSVFEDLDDKNYVEIQSKAHRFKTAFSMVGLTNIEAQLTDLERNIFNYSQHKISEILKNMDVKIENFRPILITELEKLKAAFSLKAA